VRRLVRQVFAFSVVGVISVVIDLGLFWILNNVFGVYYVVASVISFSISLIVNYILNVKYVFKRGRMNRWVEFALYVILNLIALGINTALLALCVQHFHLNPLPAKIIATVVVMVYNFISRKLLIEGWSGARARASSDPDMLAKSPGRGVV